jgi:hypothetical protein
LDKSVKLIKKAKKFQCNLYVSDIENYKSKKIKLTNNNIIIRKKFSSDKSDILYRYAYHDLYILSKKINLRGLNSFKIINTQVGEISYTFRIKKKLFKFIYSFNSSKKIHKINNVNLLSFSGNPLDKMIKKILAKKFNIDSNYKNALDTIYVINKINKIKKI